MKVLGAFMAIAGLVGCAWLLTLPTRNQCIASGRVVDPTERRCESATGYVQLREHALYHSREVIVVAVMLLGGTYMVQRFRRRIRRR